MDAWTHVASTARSLGGLHFQYTVGENYTVHGYWY